MKKERGLEKMPFFVAMLIGVAMIIVIPFEWEATQVIYKGDSV